MRSLWRTIAARWLGGQASETLTGDAMLLDLLPQKDGAALPAFRVHRQSEVSHRAMMSQQDRTQSSFETAAVPVDDTDRDA